MKRALAVLLPAVAVATAAVLTSFAQAPAGKAGAQRPPEIAVERARKTVRMLDDIYKTTVVLITDKYVYDTDDFAAGSAAVALFKTISDKGWHQVRLLDATGQPYNDENVARNAFEKQGIARLKEGQANYEQIAQTDGKPVLRVVTPVPVVHKRCVLCHPHYADAGPNEPVGAISYEVPIE